MENGKQPLLSSSRESGDQSQDQDQLQSAPVATNSSSAATFFAGAADIPPIKGPRDFFREFLIESKKLWYLAGPAIFTSLCQYSLGAITQVFAGHVGTLDLAAVSIENSVIAGFSFGLLVHICAIIDRIIY
jgi:MATE family multidrug resistance protein